jgi:protein-S-isoprenylcysteine O-methyltransferase Ste14
LAHPSKTAHFVVGLVIAALGLLLWITARLQLGESFSARARASTLVTHGLYSRIRHPVYLFGTIAIVGLIIAWGQWLWFLLPLADFPIMIRRIRREEAVLGKRF